MPTPLPQLLPQIVTLNVDTEPFAYYATGNQIIGWWDIAKAVRLGLGPVHQVDETYRFKVTLDERAGTYRTLKFTRKLQPRVDGGGIFDDDSTGGSGMFEWPEPDDWRLHPDRIEEPLLEWLHAHGWQEKRFLGGLFG